MKNVKYCLCGKIWTASEEDAKAQCALEDKIRNNDPLATVEYYSCNFGVWHWTRGINIRTECTCKDEVILSKDEDEVREYVNGLNRGIKGALKYVPYQCYSEVWHLQMGLKNSGAYVCDCGRIRFNDKKSIERFRRSLKTRVGHTGTIVKCREHEGIVHVANTTSKENKKKSARRRKRENVRK